MAGWRGVWSERGDGGGHGYLRTFLEKGREMTSKRVGLEKGQADTHTQPPPHHSAIPPTLFHPTPTPTPYSGRIGGHRDGETLGWMKDLIEKRNW